MAIKAPQATNPTTFFNTPQPANPKPVIFPEPANPNPRPLALLPLTPEVVFNLRVQCGKYLKDLGVSPKTKKYENAVMWFWMGALAGRGMTLAGNPAVSILLMSGRSNELVAE